MGWRSESVEGRKREVLLIPSLSAYIFILISLRENTWARTLLCSRTDRECLGWERNGLCGTAEIADAVVVGERTRERRRERHAPGMLTTPRLTLRTNVSKQKRRVCGTLEHWQRNWNEWFAPELLSLWPSVFCHVLFTWDGLLNPNIWE